MKKGIVICWLILLKFDKKLLVQSVKWGKSETVQNLWEVVQINADMMEKCCYEKELLQAEDRPGQSTTWA